MASNERIRKYLDAGTVLGQVSRGRAEEIVRELVNAGDIQRSQAQEWVDNLVERSRKSSEQVLETGAPRGGRPAREDRPASPSSPWPTRWPRS